MRKRPHYKKSKESRINHILKSAIKIRGQRLARRTFKAVPRPTITNKQVVDQAMRELQKP